MDLVIDREPKFLAYLEAEREETYLKVVEIQTEFTIILKKYAQPHGFHFIGKSAVYKGLSCMVVNLKVENVLNC